MPAGESLVVLTRDPALVRTLKVLGAETPFQAVQLESDLAGELLGSQIGVAILDAAATTTPINRLTGRLKEQFPDLVLIVAGRLDDQTALTAQITNGTVYRFLHKPVSEQRVKLFVEAALRRHDQESAGVSEQLAATGVIAEEPSPASRLWIGGFVLAVLLAAGSWLMLRKPAERPVVTSPSTVTTGAPTHDEQYEALIKRADAALAAGALVAPPRENAADLYRQAAQRDSADPRAAAGIEKVIAQLLSAAEANLANQHLDAAQKLTDQARSIKADHVRVAFLTTQIGKERERKVLNEARQAAASGSIEKEKLAAQLNEYLTQANERLGRGQLLEPAQDNARFFIESARAVAPGDPAVLQAGQQLQEKLVAEAKQALSAGNTDVAQHWIDAAAESGAGSDQINELTREAQRIQTTARAEAMAKVSMLFNERLAQGKIVDPANDSAKFHLAQLIQADPAHPSTILARQALANRALEEAKAAAKRQDYASAHRWLSEARDAGSDDPSIEAIERDVVAAQEAAQAEAKRATEEAAQRATDVVSAASLPLAHYVPPTFPPTAAARGVSGWVELQFLVTSEGSVSNVIITGAAPVGIFEQAAIEAVKKWRYQPVKRDGHAVDQRARLRMKFALDK